MGLPVVTVASGGLPISDNTSTSKLGMPVTEATNKFGIAVTKVTGGGGMPAVYETIGAGGASTTWNAADKNSANIALSNGNLTATATGSSGTDWGVRGTTSRTTGKYYAEFAAGSTFNGAGDTGVGIATAAANLGNVGQAGALAFVMFSAAGNIWYNGANTGKTIGTVNTPLIVGVAIDLDNKRGWFRSGAGNWNGDAAANPATNTNGVDISSVFGSSPAFALFCVNTNTSVTANFGQSAFANAAPAGFVMWG